MLQKNYKNKKVWFSQSTESWRIWQELNPYCVLCACWNLTSERQTWEVFNYWQQQHTLFLVWDLYKAAAGKFTYFGFLWNPRNGHCGVEQKWKILSMPPQCCRQNTNKSGISKKQLLQQQLLATLLFVAFLSWGYLQTTCLFIKFTQFEKFQKMSLL